VTRTNPDPQPPIDHGPNAISPDAYWTGKSDADAAVALVRRARAVIVAFWGVAATNVVGIVAGFMLSNLLRSSDGAAVSADGGVFGIEGAYGIAASAKLVALIVAGILFLWWFYLAHQNLRRFDGQPPAHHSQWAIWGFFVPVLNVLRPQQLMREIWSITSEQWKRSENVRDLQRPTDWVNLWWGLFLATGTLGNFVSLAALRATTVDEQLFATRATIFTDAFGVVAVFVAVLLVRNVTALQRPLLL